MSSIVREGAWPTIDKARRLLRADHKFAADIVDRGLASFGTAWGDRFEEALKMFAEPDALQKAISGYAAFAMHSLRLQAKFEKSLAYQAKSYAEAAAEVYHNETYMQAEYLPGLFLSHYLWPHHYRQILFFETAFLGAIRTAGASSFVEVGVGTGLYSRLTLQSLPDVVGTGIDISPSSRQFALKQMDFFGLSERYAVKLEDVTTDTPRASAEHLICVEVLEHLEDPVGFLKALRGVLKPGGRAFITAALNAAHSDHIYLYRNSGEVEAQIAEAGFVTEEFWVGQAYKAPRPGIPVPLAAAFVVY